MTKIKYKDVKIGMVLSVKLDGDKQKVNHTVTNCYQYKGGVNAAFVIVFDNRENDSFVGFPDAELDLAS